MLDLEKKSTPSTLAYFDHPYVFWLVLVQKYHEVFFALFPLYFSPLAPLCLDILPYRPRKTIQFDMVVLQIMRDCGLH